MRIAIAIAHAAFDPNRKKGLDRLLLQCKRESCETVRVFESPQPEPAHVWAVRMWRWAASQENIDATIFLNDDVDIAPGLVSAVRDIYTAREAEVLSLHCSLDVAPSLAMCGESFVRCYWLTGPGYVIPNREIVELLRFVDTAPKNFVRMNNEDNLIIHWSHYEKKRAILQTIPALVMHDVSVPSTLGYDDHERRVTSVPWFHVTGNVTLSDHWKKEEEPIEVENPWMPRANLELIDDLLVNHPNLLPAGQISIATAIIHAAHIPERAALLKRLSFALEKTMGGLEESEHRRVIDLRGPHAVWQEEAFEWATEQGASHVLTLQDDVEVSDDFGEVLRAMLAGRPEEVICLDCAHPAARTVFLDGKPGYHVTDGMVGIGHVLPVEIAEDFLRWRQEEIRSRRSLFDVTEDTMLALYLMHRQIPIFCPVPSIIDHDIEIASTNPGFDGNLYRKPQVTWKEIDRLPSEKAVILREVMRDPAWWSQDIAHVGRFYDDAHWLLPLVLDKQREGEYLALRYEEDRTPKRYERFFMRTTAVRR